MLTPRNQREREELDALRSGAGDPHDKIIAAARLGLSADQREAILAYWCASTTEQEDAALARMVALGLPSLPRSPSFEAAP